MWTSASAASCAASRAVECPVSAARADSSTAKVPSWTSSWAAWAAIRVISQGAVSPVITTFRPGRGSPSTWSGRTSEPSTATVSPRCSRPKSRSSVIPSPRAASTSKRPGRSGSTYA